MREHENIGGGVIYLLQVTDFLGILMKLKIPKWCNRKRNGRTKCVHLTNFELF